jgi:hypothetical protein
MCSRAHVQPSTCARGGSGDPPETALSLARFCRRRAAAATAAAGAGAAAATPCGLLARFARAPSSPRFCPLLTQKSSSNSSAFFFERAHEIRMAAAPSSCCSLRSRPSLLPASAADGQLYYRDRAALPHTPPSPSSCATRSACSASPPPAPRPSRPAFSRSTPGSCPSPCSGSPPASSGARSPARAASAGRCSCPSCSAGPGRGCSTRSPRSRRRGPGRG